MAPEFGNSSDKLVLIADDDAGFLQFLELTVRSEGFRVETATSGPDAIRKITDKKPDLIILDLMMPGFGGFETLRKLQGGPAENTPIIIVTARRMDELSRQMIRSEANIEDIIEKPVRMAALQLIINRVLKTPPPHSSHTA